MNNHEHVLGCAGVGLDQDAFNAGTRDADQALTGPGMISEHLDEAFIGFNEIDGSIRKKNDTRSLAALNAAINQVKSDRNLVSARNNNGVENNNNNNNKNFNNSNNNNNNNNVGNANDGSAFIAESSVHNYSTFQRSKKRPLKIKVSCSPDVEDALVRDYPEFEFDFQKLYKVSHDHAEVSRLCETELLLMRLGYRNGVNLLDIGGNYAEHVTKGRHTVHSCSPILNIRDGQRKTERLIRINRYAFRNSEPVACLHQRSVDEKTAVLDSCSTAVKKFFTDRPSIMCENKTQDCDFPADVAIAIHSIYDIKFDDLPDIMNRHKVRVLMGTFIYTPEMFVKTEGYVKGVNAYYQIDLKKDTIRFSFVGDVSTGYEHKYSNYLNYLTRHHAFSTTEAYYYELLENRSGVQFFKLVHTGSNILPGTVNLFRNFWPMCSEYMVVRVYDYGADYSVPLGNVKTLNDLSAEQIIVPRKLVQQGLSYGLGLSKNPEKLSNHAIHDYLRSMNNRVMVSGTSITVPDSIDALPLFKLATVIYMMVFLEKLRQDQVLGRLKDLSIQRLKLQKSTTTALFITALMCGFDKPELGARHESGIREYLREHCGVDFSSDLTNIRLFYAYEELVEQTVLDRLVIMGVDAATWAKNNFFGISKPTIDWFKRVFKRAEHTEPLVTALGLNSASTPATSVGVVSSSNNGSGGNTNSYTNGNTDSNNNNNNNNNDNNNKILPTRGGKTVEKRNVDSKRAGSNNKIQPVRPVKPTRVFTTDEINAADVLRQQYFCDTSSDESSTADSEVEFEPEPHAGSSTARGNVTPSAPPCPFVEEQVNVAKAAPVVAPVIPLVGNPVVPVDVAVNPSNTNVDSDTTSASSFNLHGLLAEFSRNATVQSLPCDSVHSCANMVNGIRDNALQIAVSSQATTTNVSTLLKEFHNNGLERCESLEAFEFSDEEDDSGNNNNNDNNKGLASFLLPADEDEESIIEDSDDHSYEPDHSASTDKICTDPLLDSPILASELNVVNSDPQSSAIDCLNSNDVICGLINEVLDSVFQGADECPDAEFIVRSLVDEIFESAIPNIVGADAVLTDEPLADGTAIQSSVITSQDQRIDLVSVLLNVNVDLKIANANLNPPAVTSTLTAIDSDQHNKEDRILSLVSDQAKPGTEPLQTKSDHIITQQLICDEVSTARAEALKADRNQRIVINTVLNAAQDIEHSVVSIIEEQEHEQDRSFDSCQTLVNLSARDCGNTTNFSHIEAGNCDFELDETSKHRDGFSDDLRSKLEIVKTSLLKPHLQLPSVNVEKTILVINESGEEKLCNKQKPKRDVTLKKNKIFKDSTWLRIADTPFRTFIHNEPVVQRIPNAIWNKMLRPLHIGKFYSASGTGKLCVVNGLLASLGIANDEGTMNMLVQRFIDVSSDLGVPASKEFSLMAMCLVYAELNINYVIAVEQNQVIDLYTRYDKNNRNSHVFIVRDNHVYYEHAEGTMPGIQFLYTRNVSVFTEQHPVTDVLYTSAKTQYMLRHQIGGDDRGKVNLKFETRITNSITEGFKRKIFGKAAIRKFGEHPACYYKMKEVDQETNVYMSNVLVVGPGQCGSAIYHTKDCNRFVHTVGPRESAYSHENLVELCPDFFDDNFVLPAELVSLIPELTFENDAMTGYKGCPSKTHIKILKSSYNFIHKYQIDSVVHKIFLNDNNYAYNILLYKLINSFSEFKFIKPKSASVGSTEVYVVLKGFRQSFDVRNTVLKEREFTNIISNMLAVAYMELKNREVYTQMKSQQPSILEEHVSKFEKNEQLARIRDVHKYWSLEVSQLSAYATKMWAEIDVRNQRFNNSAARMYYESDSVGFLRHAGHGKYRPFYPHGNKQVFYFPCGEYDVAFDGKTFVPVEMHTDLEGQFYQTDRSVDVLMVFDALRLFQADRKLTSIDFSEMRAHSAEIILIEGVPGAGKTYELTHSVKNDDIVLTFARETKKETAARIEALGKTTAVYTVDSYYINHRSKCDIIYVDEGLMLQPGELDIIANLSQAKRIIVFGDRKQLGFIPRVAGFIPKYLSYNDFTKVMFRNVSYRCPKDVASLFANQYSCGFYTKSKISRSLKVNMISAMYEIPKTNDKFLTFTQSEKKDLLKYGFPNVNTIHEVQGMTFEHVRLVRLNAKQMSLYDSESHILVALTRHTKSFIYYTTRYDDKVTKLIQSSEVSPDADNMVKANVHAKNYMQRCSLKSDEPVAKFITYEKAYTIDIKQVKEVTIESAVGKQLFDHLVEKKALLEGNVNNSELTVVNAVTFHEPVPMREGTFIELEDPATALQMYYDSVIPGGSSDYNVFDEHQVETSDMRLYVSNLKIDASKIGESTDDSLPQHRYECVVRTNQPNLRPRSSRQTLLALEKRNCDTPKNALPIDINDEINQTIQAFKTKFCVKEVDTLLTQYQHEPVTFEQRSLAAWLDTQQTDKLKRFDKDETELELRNVMQYQMMIKTDPKNKLEAAAVNEYLSVQNIIHHKHFVTAVFGSVFKFIFERFQKILRPEFMVMLKKNTSQLQQHLNMYLKHDTRYRQIEIDFSKFDKSQLQLCHETEMHVWRILGMDQYLHSLWKLGHFDTTAIDYLNGVIATLMFQRRSGDAATCFGNTLISMLALARCTDLRTVASGYFVGDDSIMFMESRGDLTHIVRALAEIFNLSAKLIDKRHAYFCSNFIIQTYQGWVVVPDPLKRIERLGKKLYIQSETELYERYVSLNELMKNLFVNGVDNLLCEALAERYGDSDAAFLALDALRTISRNFAKFSALYQKASVTALKFKSIKTEIRI